MARDWTVGDVYPRSPPTRFPERESAMFTNSSDDRRLEARARRAARRVGYLVRKSRQRTNVPNLHNLGGYMLIDAERNWVVQGSDFELSAQDVIEFCERTAAYLAMHG